jgi:hypothetical protein
MKKPRSASPRSKQREERALKKSLKAHGQLHEGKGPLPPGATHVLEKRAGKKPALVRKRFSAI